MKIFLYSCCLVFSLRLSAQSLPSVLHGVISIEGGEILNYDLSLQATDTPGYYRGTSTTFLAKGRESISRIHAVVNATAKTVILTESEIIENRGFSSRAIICLITAQLAYDPYQRVLKGSLASSTAGNGAACAKGSITLLNEYEIQPYFAAGAAQGTPVYNAAVKAKPPSEVTKKTPQFVYDTASIAGRVREAVPEKMAIITAGKDGHLDWHTEQIILSYWDNGIVDGDKVNIRFDGVLVAEQQLLVSTPQILRLPITTQGIHILSIEAMNEGSQAPNTCTLTLQDGDKTHRIEANNKIGKAALIRLNKLP